MKQHGYQIASDGKRSSLAKLLGLCAGLAVSLSLWSNDQVPITDLSPLHWQHRIILVFTDQPESTRKELKRLEDEVLDRDIVWFVLNINDHQQVDTNFEGEISSSFADNMRTKFGAEDARVFLIGKDGGVKNRNDTLYPKILFDEIDSMPMRIEEMRQQDQ